MERETEDGRQADATQAGAQVVRLRPLRVLVVSADRRFRAVIAMLVAGRGCCPFDTSSCDDIAATLARERVDVVLVDGADLLAEVARDVACSDATAPPVGVVLVGEDREPALSGLRALAKWDSFDTLFAAILAADRGRAGPPPPTADRSAGLSVARARELG